MPLTLEPSSPVQFLSVCMFSTFLKWLSWVFDLSWISCDTQRVPFLQKKSHVPELLQPQEKRDTKPLNS